jgi:hypothetical protein
MKAPSNKSSFYWWTASKFHTLERIKSSVTLEIADIEHNIKPKYF